LYVIHGLQDGAVAVLIKMHHATNQIQRVVMARALLG
jgi:hypothetical protein